MMTAGLAFEVQHRTCEGVDPDDPAPVMYLERAEDDAGIFTCPRCHAKVSVFLSFSREASSTTSTHVILNEPPPREPPMDARLEFFAHALDRSPQLLEAVRAVNRDPTSQAARDALTAATEAEIRRWSTPSPVRE